MNTAQRGTEQQSRAARLQAAVILTVLLLAISCAAGHSYLVSSFTFSGNNPGIQRDASVAQIALAWLLAKKVVASIIVGATKPHQLEDNLKSVHVKLTDAELAELDTLTAPTPIYPNWFNAVTTDVKHKEALG